MRLADPGRICAVVIPPARARGNCGSCGHTECSAHTFAVTGLVASFPSLFACTPGAAYTPMCECVSTIPGVTNLPAPSITIASAGASTDAPTAAILPSRSRIAPFTMRGPTAVQMVTFRMTVARDGNGVYVLGNGSASGAERAPDPVAP